MRYGFKVHTLELARGMRGRKRLAVTSCLHDGEAEKYKKAQEVEEASGGQKPPPLVTGDYLAILVKTLTDLRDRQEALTDVPKLIAVVDGSDEFVPSDDPGTVRMRVVEVDVSGRRVSVTVEYGYLGYAHKGLAQKRDDDAPLENKSPVEYYRTEFLVPDEGEIGLVATEAISRASSLPALVAWINHTCRTRSGDNQFVRLMAHQLTDSARVKGLLTGKNISEIQLFRRNDDVDGVPHDNKITLTETVRDTSTMRAATDLIEGWIERIKSKKPMTESERQEAIQALVGVVGEEFEDVGFNDGVVKLDPGSGAKIAVKPSRVGELFVYEISDARPTVSVWEERTKAQLMAMANVEDLSVEWSWM